MSPLSCIRCLLLVSLFFSCVLISSGKGGRGGGGRSSSRSSSSSSRSSSSSSSYGRSYSSPSKSSSSSYSFPSSSKSSSSVTRYSPSFPSKSSSSSSSLPSKSSSSYGSIHSANYERQSYLQKPLAPPATFAQGGIYNIQPQSSEVFKSSHSSFPQVGIPNANYPRQPISSNSFSPAHSSFSQGGMSNANYPKQDIPSNPFFQSSSSQGGIPSASYPRQPISSNYFLHSQSSSSQGNIPNTNFPRQPSSNPFFQSPSAQGGIPNFNYPRQPISSNPVKPLHTLTSQGGIPNANYPRQSYQSYGNSQPQGPHARERPTIQVQPSITSSFQNRAPNGFSSANYPKQPQILGSGVWNPKSGVSSPVYMNYGGLPTGANMYSKPLKKKGFLGSLVSLGSSSKPYKNKHYSSYPSPYGMGGGRPSDVLGSFMGNKGSKKAMYTILPYMAARKAPKIFKPKFRFYSYRPIRYYSHGYHSHGYHSYVHDTELDNVRYDVYNNDYVGSCNRPITPDHASIMCNSTHNQVVCGVSCEEGYRYADATTSKWNKCWHATGVWNPTKNFPACEPVCNETCLHGGKCASPGVCGCASEYRGPHCEFHFLNCDIRKLAKGLKIRWVCTHSKKETSCRVKCKSPAELSTQSDAVYKCTPEGVWTPSEMPLCEPPDSESSSVLGEDPIVRYHD